MFYKGFRHLVLSQQQLTFYLKNKVGKIVSRLNNYTFATGLATSQSAGNDILWSVVL